MISGISNSSLSVRSSENRCFSCISCRHVAKIIDKKLAIAFLPERRRLAAYVRNLALPTFICHSIGLSSKSSIVQPITLDSLYTVWAWALSMSLTRCSYIWMERSLTPEILASSDWDSPLLSRSFFSRHSGNDAAHFPSIVSKKLGDIHLVVYPVSVEDGLRLSQSKTLDLSVKHSTVMLLR